MNPCRRYEKSLILYSYQEIGRRKVVSLQRHLGRCERCQGYLEGLGRVSQIIKSQYAPLSNLFLDIEEW